MPSAHAGLRSPTPRRRAHVFFCFFFWFMYSWVSLSNMKVSSPTKALSTNRYGCCRTQNVVQWGTARTSHDLTHRRAARAGAFYT